ncbi:hypothetical protein D3C77_422400 [compost metagenome]
MTTNRRTSSAGLRKVNTTNSGLIHKKGSSPSTEINIVVHPITVKNQIMTENVNACQRFLDREPTNRAIAKKSSTKPKEKARKSK